jgi:hypothetical protein
MKLFFLCSLSPRTAQASETKRGALVGSLGFQHGSDPISGDMFSGCLHAHLTRAAVTCQCALFLGRERTLRER